MNSQFQKRKNLYICAYIVNIITTVIFGILVIPLLWCVPMTILSRQAYLQVGSKQEKAHFILGSFSLFFLNFISGCLILFASTLFINLTDVVNHQQPTKNNVKKINSRDEIEKLKRQVGGLEEKDKE